MKIAILGSGSVGTALGDGWRAAGHEIRFGGRAEEANAAAVEGADVVVLAVPGSAIDASLFEGLDLTGKVVVDATNPIAADFSGLTEIEEGSSAERVAQLVPHARVVKAFNSIGFNIMANPRFGTEAASLLLAGDDNAANETVGGLARDLGFEPVVAGPLSMARSLEHFAWLWISMAMKHGHGREIAFRLLRR